MPDQTINLIEPADLSQAIADSRGAGQRFDELAELAVFAYEGRQQWPTPNTSDARNEVRFALQIWLDTEVAAGTLIERNGRYYMALTEVEYRSDATLRRADLLDGVAGAAGRVSEALAELDEAWNAADVDGDPLLRGQLHAGWPFPDRLGQITGKVRLWADNVHAGVGAAANEPRACAAAIRQHLKDLQPRLERDFAEWADSTTASTKYDNGSDPLSNFYEASIRNGLGGIFGDVAASASPAFLSTVADLLDYIADNPKPHSMALAERVAAAYRASRGRDDERSY